MKKTLNKLKDGIILGIGFLLVIGIAQARTGLQATTGDTLTADKWNELVDKVGGIFTDISGNVGIGTEVPGAKLEVVGTGDNGMIIKGDENVGLEIIGNINTHSVILKDSSRLIAPINRSIAVEINGNDAGDRFSVITAPSNNSISDTEVFSVLNSGEVLVSGVLDIGLVRVSDSCSGDDCINDISCPAGKKLLSGGCSFTSCSEFGRDASFPLSGLDTWRCQSNQCVTNVGYALCARIQ